jgi:hypothetical protein
MGFSRYAEVRRYQGVSFLIALRYGRIEKLEGGKKMPEADIDILQEIFLN